MRSCIASFYLTVLAGLEAVPAIADPALVSSPRPGRGPAVLAEVAREGGESKAPATQAGTPDDPDALYRQREDLAAARRAAEIWRQRLARRSDDFEAAWKLARACYWLGHHGPEAGRRRDLEAGVAAARAAAAIRPDRPEGHFWLAANLGGLAESGGVFQGLRSRGAIKAALERVLAIDPAYLGGAADRALGRWYYKVPRAFGGSLDRAVDHLRRALAYDPDSTIGRYFLAEALLRLGRPGEARAELQRVLDAPFDPDFTPEDREWKARARALLADIR
jgi:tetratricopeptide (TPR) repeat protein